MKYLFFLFISSILCFTGCSTKTSLGYSPVIQQQEKNHIDLTIGEFEDKREEGQQIGALRNIFGMPIIKIITDDNVPHWVMNAFKMELTNAGYSIVSSYPVSYVIEGKIIKAYASTYFLYHGSMIVELSLKKNDQVIFQKIYETKENAGANWIAQASMCAEALKYNLQSICKSFIKDINQHLWETSKVSTQEKSTDRKKNAFHKHICSIGS
jgi:hypothetical protein